MEEEKKIKEENEQRYYIALAIALGVASASDVDPSKPVPAAVKEAVDTKLASAGLLPSEITGEERLSEQQIVQKAAAVAQSFGAHLFKVVTMGDDKVCDECRAWEGKVLTIVPDGKHKLLDEFMTSEGLHYGCRCAIEAVKEDVVANTAPEEAKKKNKRISIKELTKMAMAETVLKDKVVYRGFIDNSLDSDIDPLTTENFGETLVMLAPLGTTEGWSKKENKAVEEIVDDEALDNIVKNYSGEELLLDIDHRSMRDPMQRSTEAAGWIKNLTAVKSDSPLAGLYGTIKWTETGRKLVEARDYRFLSPVFVLDDNNRPEKLINCALTNRPAFKDILPILNTATLEKNIYQETISMTIDEVKTLINSCVDEKIKAMNACGEEKKEETVAAETPAEEKAEETKEETKEETAAETAEETKEEIKEEIKEETKEEMKEEKKEETKEEVAAEAPKTEELIKEEALNSTPTIVEDKLDAWKNLRGKEFISWLDKHPRGL